jgi:hypothetical protein
MNESKPPIALIAAAVLALVIAGGLYAKKVYRAPEAPPQLIWTNRGAVLLYPRAEPGDIITSPDIDTIYYINSEGKRVVFPDAQTYESWYGDFSALKTIPRDVLESYPLSGRNATIRPGTYLVKIQSSPQVWMIGFPNALFWLAQGEPQAKAIFGETWQERLVDIPEYYFANYTEGADLYGHSLYPAGTLIHIKENNQWYLVTPEGQRPVTEKGMKENHFQATFAVELGQPLDLPLGPTLDGYEARWGSPDLHEQSADRGPVEIKTMGARPEVG